AVQPYGAEDLLHGRVRDLVLHALGAVERPGDEVARRVLEGERGRGAVGVALALLGNAARVRGHDAAADARSRRVRLGLADPEQLLRRGLLVRVSAEDPSGRVVARDVVG